MMVVGLSGSIGMGKTTAARMLRRLGVPVFDADAAVHRLLGPNGRAVAPVAQAFPGVLRSGAHGDAIDRQALGRQVFADSAALARLETMVHPLVAALEHRFIVQARRQRRPLAVLDIPLLFETGRARDCDVTLVVSAPAFIQAQRVLRRPGMTPAKLAGIRRRQMPDTEKRRRADHVIPTGLSKGHTMRRLRGLVARLRRRATTGRRR